MISLSDLSTYIVMYIEMCGYSELYGWYNKQEKITMLSDSNPASYAHDWFACALISCVPA